jgi:LPXTG-motif cell wall-anchored protein
MRYLALLATYALVAALVLPGSIFAQDEAATGTATTPAQPAAPEPAPAAPTPATPAPAPPPAQPAQPAPPEPAPAEAAPAPQFLGDEGAGKASASEPKALAAASGSVTIADFTFAPATITVNQGDTVTWNNNGPTPHSATANDGAFDTGILKKGQTSSHTFDQAGTFSYFCKPHPFMKATVVVQAAQSGGGDTSGSGSSDTGGSSDTSGGSGAGASQSDDGGPALPNTGADSGAMLVLGGLMLLLGIRVHRRTAAGKPRPAGRIGW